MVAPAVTVNIILYAAAAGAGLWLIAMIIWVMTHPVLFMMMINHKDMILWDRHT
jgi:hypothetical protein